MSRVTEGSARLIPKQPSWKSSRAKARSKHRPRARTCGGAAGHAWAGAPPASYMYMVGRYWDAPRSTAPRAFFVIFGVTQPGRRGGYVT